MHRIPRSLVVIWTALVVAMVLAPLALVADASPWVEDDSSSDDDAGGVPVVRVEGRGHGHGVGMSQWGAYTMATHGLGAVDILARFYPGTAMGTAGGEVVVGLVERPTIAVSLPAGGELRSNRGGAQVAGFPIPLAPGEVVQILRDGSGYRVIRGGVQPLTTTAAVEFRAAAEDDCLVLCDRGSPDDPGSPEPEPEPEPDESAPEPGDPGAADPGAGPCILCTTTTTAPPDGGGGPPGRDEGRPAPAIPTTTTPEKAPPPATTTPPADAPRSPTPIWAVPAASGTATSHDRGRTYRGIFEVVGAPDALRLRNHVDIEQYLMGMAEVPGTWPAAAVQAQAVAARTYALRAMSGGEICDSESCQVYVGVSHESAGQRAAVEATRGWVVTYGGGLAATFYSASGGGHSATVAEGFGSQFDLPYLQAHPYETDNPKHWSIDVALTDVANRMGYPGTVTDVVVTAVGPSGRAVGMALEGDAGMQTVDPQDFRRRLGLQSTLFSATVAVAAAPPPPREVESEGIDMGPDPAGRGGAQFDELFVTPDAGSQVAIGTFESGAAPTRPGVALTLLVAVMAGALVLGAWRALKLGTTVTADGLSGTVIGAPADGIRAQIAATMGTWSPQLPRPRLPRMTTRTTTFLRGIRLPSAHFRRVRHRPDPDV